MKTTRKKNVSETDFNVQNAIGMCKQFECKITNKNIFQFSLFFLNFNFNCIDGGTLMDCCKYLWLAIRMIDMLQKKKYVSFRFKVRTGIDISCGRFAIQSMSIAARMFETIQQCGTVKLCTISAMAIWHTACCIPKCLLCIVYSYIVLHSGGRYTCTRAMYVPPNTVCALSTVLFSVLLYCICTVVPCSYSLLLLLPFLRLSLFLVIFCSFYLFSSVGDFK